MEKSRLKGKLPSWVQWIAQDSDGCWWGFESEPNLSYNGWYENEIGRYIKLAEEAPDQKWRMSLHRVQ